MLLLFWATLVWYEDKLLRYAVDSLNENLDAELHFSQTSTAPFRHFPYISVALGNLSIKKKQSSKPDTLAYAQSMYFTFDLFDIWQGNYQIAQIYAENGFVRAEANAKGVWNWEILKKNKKETEENKEKRKKLRLNLIQLRNIKIQFHHARNAQVFEAITPSSSLHFAYSPEKIEIKTQSELDIRQLKIGNYAFYVPQKAKIDLDFEKTPQNLNLRKAILQTGSAEYAAKGSYIFDTQQLDFELNSEKGNLTDLFRLLPVQLSTDWEKYRSEGKIYFELKAKGTPKNPDLKLRFGCSEATFYYPDLDKQIDSISLDGFLEKNNSVNLLTIKQIAGRTEKSFFAGKGEYEIQSSQIRLDLRGFVDLLELGEWLPKENLKIQKGKLIFDLQHEGKAGSQDFARSKGKVSLENLEMEIKKYPALSEGKMEAIFEDNRFEIKALSAKLGKSETRISGEIRNWQAFLKKEFDQIETDFRLYFSNIDTKNFTQKNTNSEGKNKPQVVPHLVGKHHILLQIDTLIYKDLAIQKLRTEVDFSRYFFRWENSSLELAKGSLRSNGKLDFTDTSRIETQIDVLARNIDMTVLLEQTENLGQKNLKAEQLSGLLSLDFQGDMAFDQKFDLIKPSLKAEIGVKIQNGVLRNYAPLRKMGEWLKDRDWENLKFGEMENRFVLDSQTLIVPKMEVRTTAGTVFLWGIQRFEPKNEFEYHLQIPLRNLSAPPESLEKNEKGASNVFLKVVGSLDNFQIQFDKPETVRKMKEDLKRKWERFKNLFRRK